VSDSDETRQSAPSDRPTGGARETTTTSSSAPALRFSLPTDDACVPGCAANGGVASLICVGGCAGGSHTGCIVATSSVSETSSSSAACVNGASSLGLRIALVLRVVGSATSSALCVAAGTTAGSTVTVAAVDCETASSSDSSCSCVNVTVFADLLAAASGRRSALAGASSRAAATGGVASPSLSSSSACVKAGRTDDADKGGSAGRAMRIEVGGGEPVARTTLLTGVATTAARTGIGATAAADIGRGVMRAAAAAARGARGVKCSGGAATSALCLASALASSSSSPSSSALLLSSLTLLTVTGTAASCMTRTLAGSLLSPCSAASRSASPATVIAAARRLFASAIKSAKASGRCNNASPACREATRSASRPMGARSSSAAKAASLRMLCKLPPMISKSSPPENSTWSTRMCSSGRVRGNSSLQAPAVSNAAAGSCPSAPKTNRHCVSSNKLPFIWNKLRWSRWPSMCAMAASLKYAFT